MPYTKGYRYGIVPGSDNKYTVAHKEIQSPAFNANIAIAAQSPDTNEIIVDFGQLTGALAVTADIIQPFTGDKMTCLYSADGTNRVVTPGAGFVGAGTVTVVASKFASVTYMFSGKAAAWVEISRYVQS